VQLLPIGASPVAVRDALVLAAGRRHPGGLSWPDRSTLSWQNSNATRRHRQIRVCARRFAHWTCRPSSWWRCACG